MPHGMPHGDEMSEDMPMDEMPMDEMPEAGGTDVAGAIDQILATGAGTGEEILAALEEQGFMVHSESEMPGGEEPPAGLDDMMGEDPMGEEMPMEEEAPMSRGDELLDAAKFGMEEDRKKKASAPPF
tara:strand:- start:229 stop:609 length:381 start_codon:yes stop_codon:yes gene_type:complete